MEIVDKRAANGAHHARCRDTWRRLRGQNPQPYELLVFTLHPPQALQADGPDHRGARTSGIPVREAEYPELEEIPAVLMNIESDVLRVMVAVGAGSALLRSQVRRTEGEGPDFSRLWFNLKRPGSHA